jgi:hypothetical protein
MASPTITPEQGAYAVAVSKGSGLSLATVLAWVLGENGPANNYLGVMVPGTQTLATYATPAQGAAGAVSVLRQSNFKPVLATAAETDDPKVELAAIAASPWNGSGTKQGYLHLLLGTLSSLSGKKIDPATGQINAGGGGGGGFLSGVESAGIDAATGNPIGAATDVVGSVVGGLVPDSLNPSSWVGDLTGWLQKESALALAYVVLTVLGLALVIFGGLDTFGYSPARAAAAVKSGPLPEPIPF